MHPEDRLHVRLASGSGCPFPHDIKHLADISIDFVLRCVVHAVRGSVHAVGPGYQENDADCGCRVSLELRDKLAFGVLPLLEACRCRIKL
jgi:hypothetical protein